MDWLFDNFQLIVVVGGAIAYWLNQRRKTQEEAEAPPEQPTRHGETTETDEVRRIQEEIRRKIAERSGQRPHAQPPVPQDVRPAREMPRNFSENVPEPPPLPRRRVVVDDSEEVERQARLAAELRRLEERRRESRELVERVRQADVTARAFPTAAAAGQTTLPHEFLRDPEALKRAVIMREVLGPPVSMR